MTFSDLALSEPILRAVKAQGYSNPTPIQAKAIPPALEGRDVLGVAQTGTGKTAAFTLPILQCLSARNERPTTRSPRALILTPTRELAAQIGDSLKTYGAHLRHRHTVIYGGVGQQRQVDALRRGVDTLVATPGRLLDLMDQEHLYLDHVEFFVLDEADRMLDMGFVRDVQRVVRELPRRRQNLLFSATMPKAVQGLAGEILYKHVEVAVKPESTTAERISQRVLFVQKADKKQLLEELFRDPALDRAIVFTRTKHGANRVAKYLDKRGVSCDAIHGNKSQTARQRALRGFRDGRVRALIATDIASRGIDVEDVSHVVNFDLPNIPESYVHRIGRTARAGAEGYAVSFCDADEVDYLRDIERTIRQSVEVDGEHRFHDERIASLHARGANAGSPSNGRGGSRSGRGGNQSGSGRTSGASGRPNGGRRRSGGSRRNRR
ncbi:MAG: DEAD/DEAH box helicase [Rhodothermales bacterium]|nr:DEAD/DEAH box helicase [Rhodothermales bacterium]MBO6778381.1 DEAD/DEAH box helicase [Rhodothermales bacterium]